MVRVVIDTNLLLSAILTHRGNPARILNLFRKDLIEIAISDDILKEMDRVLHYPKLKKRHGWSPQEISLFLKELRQFCIVVQPPTRESLIIEKDPTDDKYLDCAVASEANYIITGDQDLLGIGQYQGIKIVTPKVFLEIEGF